VLPLPDIFIKAINDGDNDSSSYDIADALFNKLDHL
jgi:hypothetical protein